MADHNILIQKHIAIVAATGAEIDTGTDNTKYATPAGLKAKSKDWLTAASYIEYDTTTLSIDFIIV